MKISMAIAQGWHAQIEILQVWLIDWLIDISWRSMAPFNGLSQRIYQLPPSLFLCQPYILCGENILGKHTFFWAPNMHPARIALTAWKISVGIGNLAWVEDEGRKSSRVSQWRVSCHGFPCCFASSVHWKVNFFGIVLKKSWMNNDVFRYYCLFFWQVVFLIDFQVLFFFSQFIPSKWFKVLKVSTHVFERFDMNSKLSFLFIWLLDLTLAC